MPRKEYEKSIKVVVALYILVAVLRPMQTTFPDWKELWSAEQTDAVDFSGYRAQLEQQALEEQLEQALTAQGIEGQVQVSVGPPLTVTGTCNDPEHADSILRQTLGDEAEIIIKSEEPIDGT